MDAGKSRTHGYTVKARVGDAICQWRQQGRLFGAQLIECRCQKCRVAASLLGQLVCGRQAVQKLGGGCRARAVAKESRGWANQSETQHARGAAIADDIDVAGCEQSDKGGRALEIV